MTVDEKAAGRSGVKGWVVRPGFGAAAVRIMRTASGGGRLLLETSVRPRSRRATWLANAECFAWVSWQPRPCREALWCPGEFLACNGQAGAWVRHLPTPKAGIIYTKWCSLRRWF